ncbi:aldose 1-epimerase family protein [Ensifer soli]|uniref:aldose 1-epimerase family protein n=1 Tax=Ciceribacter sp. sgz301302 TaxID=3342379 RepID=UPI0035B8823A
MTETVRIASGDLVAEIADLGAELQSLTTAEGRALLWSGDPAFWTGRSPVLFPIVGKAPGDRIAVDGVDYPMAQHGFARRSAFTLAEAGASACRHVLVACEATRAAYPFDFRLEVAHRLDGPMLTVTAEVRNEDARPMPFGLGFHPAFLWPLPGAAGRAHTIVLDNGAEPPLARLAGGLLVAEELLSPFRSGRLVLDHALFADDAMIFPEGAGTGLRYAPEGGAGLRFHFDNLPNLALWTKPGAPYICIEPWHGMAARDGESGEIAARPFSQTLEPGASARFSFSVVVE